MMEIIGGIAGLLLFVKIIAHLYLLSKIEEDFTLLSYSMYSYAKRGKMILPVFEDVPKQYRWLKNAINFLFAISVLGIIVFLIWYNAFRKNDLQA
jgi:hypothetical protein